jgi:ubiquinone/menaquinone biosynthesis C-methylase UbiE
VVADMQEIPFPNNNFDIYISLRSIHCSCVDLKKAIDEAKRVTVD